MSTLSDLKKIYWKVRETFIYEGLYGFIDYFLELIGLQKKEHWCRVVMNQETLSIISTLESEKLSVLEISGDSWKDAQPFMKYKSVDYPAYDVCSSPLDETFDLIIAEQVWEHILWPYRAGKNVYQMLNPGGYFLVTTPFLLRVHDVPVDCSRWTETGLAHLLAECGFPLQEIQTGSWGNYQCVKSNLKRWIPYRPLFHSLNNEAEYPLSVWALARKNNIF